MPILEKKPLDPHPAFRPAGPRTAVKKRSTYGEPMVWLTSVGLSIGLLMVAALLAVVLVNGLTVFWPKPVVAVTLSPDAKDSVGGAKSFAGIVTKHQKKITHTAVVPGQKASAAPYEWQFYIGNKDLYGLGYKYVDNADIAAMSRPKDLILIERLEYGNAIGRAVSLVEDDGSVVAAEHPSFTARFSAKVNTANQRREEIKVIEKSKIGRVNARMRELTLQKQQLEKQVLSLPKDRQDDPELRHERESIEHEESGLQEAYDQLAGQARALREVQNASTLKYRLLSGQEKDLPMGQVVGFYYPNQLSLIQKIGHFFHSFWKFLAEEPREANTEGGIFPAIFGTFVMTLMMSLAVTPFGVIAAIYLREYAKQGLWVRMVRIAVNNLAGVPSIVFGVFGLGFFVYFVGGTMDKIFFSSSLPTPTFGTGGILWAALTLALMTVPVVIVATEESLAAVPRGVREGSLACGASKWQTIRRVVLPAAAPGIMTGFILAMARGAGEVAPLMMVGVVKLAPTLPIDAIFPFVHFERKFMHLGFHIYDLGFQSPDSEAAKPMVFATTLVLILLILALNLTAVRIRQNLRKKYALSAV
jgi:phosphate transport system permease protein